MAVDGHVHDGEGHADKDGHAHDGDCCADGHAHDGKGHAHDAEGHGHGGYAHDGEGHAHQEGMDDGGDEGGAPDMAGLESMMGGMGGGEGGGMDMSALMAMLGKGGGKGGGMGDMMGGMGDMMGGMGGKGGGKGGGKAPEDNDEKPGGEKWFWQQKGEEIQIRIVCDPPATKKDVSVKFKSTSLTVTIRGESIVEGTLGGKVEVDECTWVLSPDKSELQVMLTQVAGKTDAWKSLLA